MFLRKVKKPKPGFKAFLKDPLTYISAGVMVAPAGVQHIIGYKPHPDDMLVGIGVGALMSGMMVLGAGGVFYSLHMHASTLSFSDAIDDYKAKKRREKARKESWEKHREWVRGMKGWADKMEKDGFPNEKYIQFLEEAETTSDARTANRAVRRMLDMAHAYMASRKHQLKALQAPQPIPEFQSPEEKYIIVPDKTYPNLSENKRRRVDYFIGDVAGIIDDESLRKELFREIKKSRWYTEIPDDIRTYAFFDDITLALRRGEMPTYSQIEKYKSVKLPSESMLV